MAFSLFRFLKKTDGSGAAPDEIDNASTVVAGKKGLLGFFAKTRLDGKAAVGNITKDGKLEIDQSDLTGTTTHFAATVGTTEISLPPSPVSGKIVSEVLINTQIIDSTAQRLLVSFNGGSTFMTFKRNTVIGWFVRGQHPQIKIKGNEAGVPYDVIINLEDLA